jgi:hypothetical protein
VSVNSPSVPVTIWRIAGSPRYGAIVTSTVSPARLSAMSPETSTTSP